MQPPHYTLKYIVRPMQALSHWWRSAVIYQIYPRSYADSNGDGVGDLRGITAKLPYVRDLGVDAIWISPFFPSPMKDFGYDVSDYWNIDPLFGTLDDFDALIEAAHALGLKVIIDQVWSHTSTEHPWFIESRSNRTNPKADWFVWVDPLPDGTPPNNWRSIFGGSAWQWEPRRHQYYLHNFLVEQADINWLNDEAVAALMDVGRFWLKRGVDGFRLDAINYLLHDPALRSNRARPPEMPWPEGVSPGNPFGRQLFDYNINQPGVPEKMKAVRALMNEFPGTMTMGELVNAEDSATLAAAYVGEEGLHTCYTWGLLHPQASDKKEMARILRHVTAAFGDHPHTWALGNHDFKRLVSRWGQEGQKNDALAKMALTLTGFLNGSVCLYQGDELGLTEAEIPFEAMRDPYGITFYPEFKGRDGCRTPMPWKKDGENAGFGVGTPWLPVPTEHRAQAVDVQEKDAASVLSYARWFFAWRKQQAALLEGTMTVLDEGLPDNLIGIQRTLAGHTVTGYFNLSSLPVSLTLQGCLLRPGHADRIVEEYSSGVSVTLEGFGVVIVQS
jgi:alpha-glucosidase